MNHSSLGNHLIIRALFLLCTVLLPTGAWKDRFTVFWNVPAERCFTKYNVSFPLDQFRIVHNEKFKFNGDKVVLFYEYKTGLFPYYQDYNTSRPVNGGLPQLVDILAHLNVVEEQIKDIIPDENFDGPAVFDVEEWRPMFHLNWGRKGIYRNESVRLVRERFPSISLKSARVIAEDEFNSAAKKLLVATLQLARRLRPRAKWGMYGFPYCNYDAGQSGEHACSANFQGHNDRLQWLTDEFTALTPSIYLDLASNNTAANYRYIHSVMNEARRIASKSTVSPPILPYTKFEYNPYETPEEHIYYYKRDLCNSIKLSAEAGASGVLVWSTDKYVSKGRCEGMKKYIGHSFGPAANLVRKRSNRCATERCSGNGRCLLRTPQQRCSFRMPPSDYTCACDESFYGPRCERKHHIPIPTPAPFPFEEIPLLTPGTEIELEPADPVETVTRGFWEGLPSYFPTPLPAPATLEEESE